MGEGARLLLPEEESLGVLGRVTCRSVEGVASGEVEASDADRVNEGVLVPRTAATFLSRLRGVD
jgi:hypothetical protein